MANVQVTSTIEELAARAAEMTVRVLQGAIAAQGHAVWVLAGGTAPMDAYVQLARSYREAVDWSKVLVLLGDERCVPDDDPEATWPHIYETLLKYLPLRPDHVLQPTPGVSAESASARYAQLLGALPYNERGVPRFDLLWLGMGEDGHTLSLFPGRPELALTQPFVVPVHDSPKPPADRITLTFGALTNVGECMILTAGDGKAEAVARALDDDMSLPIVQAVKVIELGRGQVTWLLDAAAGRMLAK